jgi:hypothetical protein
MLSNAILLGNNRLAIKATSCTANHGSEANFIVDLLHALEVGLRGAFRAEDNVLTQLGQPLSVLYRQVNGTTYHFFQRESLGLRNKKPDEGSTHEGQETK